MTYFANTIRADVEIVHSTEKAYLCKLEDGRQVWVPKFAVRHVTVIDGPKFLILTISKEIADQKGIVAKSSAPIQRAYASVDAGKERAVTQYLAMLSQFAEYKVQTVKMTAEEIMFRDCGSDFIGNASDRVYATGIDYEVAYFRRQDIRSYKMNTAMIEREIAAMERAMRKIKMKLAWQIAREGSSQFGGDTKQYIAQAMKEVF